ncbi:MAG TPA: cation transporter dimerization domain-containing protein [Paludibacter sp.]|nr:cation transporter dimerization domain-containing protein [Paludibacter sp.]
MEVDRAPQESFETIEKVLNTFPEIKSFHDLKIRTSGADSFIKVKVHFDPELTLKETHDLCDRIELGIQKLVPRCEVSIHAEPNEENHILTEK